MRWTRYRKSNGSNRNTVSSLLSFGAGPPNVTECRQRRLSTSTRGGLLQLPAGAGPPGALRAFAEGAVGKWSQTSCSHPRGREPWGLCARWWRRAPRKPRVWPESRFVGFFAWLQPSHNSPQVCSLTVVINACAGRRSQHLGLEKHCGLDEQPRSSGLRRSLLSKCSKGPIQNGHGSMAFDYLFFVNACFLNIEDHRVGSKMILQCCCSEHQYVHL